MSHGKKKTQSLHLATEERLNYTSMVKWLICE